MGYAVEPIYNDKVISITKINGCISCVKFDKEMITVKFYDRDPKVITLERKLNEKINISMSEVKDNKYIVYISVQNDEIIKGYTINSYKGAKEICDYYTNYNKYIEFSMTKVDRVDKVTEVDKVDNLSCTGTIRLTGLEIYYDLYNKNKRQIETIKESVSLNIFYYIDTWLIFEQFYNLYDQFSFQDKVRIRDALLQFENTIKTFNILLTNFLPAHEIKTSFWNIIKLFLIDQFSDEWINTFDKQINNDIFGYHESILNYIDENKFLYKKSKYKILFACHLCHIKKSDNVIETYRAIFSNSKINDNIKFNSLNDKFLFYCVKNEWIVQNISDILFKDNDIDIKLFEYVNYKSEMLDEEYFNKLEKILCKNITLIDKYESTNSKFDICTKYISEKYGIYSHLGYTTLFLIILGAIKYYSEVAKNIYKNIFIVAENTNNLYDFFLHNESSLSEKDFCGICTYFIFASDCKQDIYDIYNKLNIECTNYKKQEHLKSEFKLIESSLKNSQQTNQMTINDVDLMDGIEFENLILKIFTNEGYTCYKTKISHDQGLDIIAEKNNVKIGIQAKRYKSNVGNKAIQEAIAGKKYYNCNKIIVISNSYFTLPAQQLAIANNVIVWDREILKEKISILY